MLPRAAAAVGRTLRGLNPTLSGPWPERRARSRPRKATTSSRRWTSSSRSTFARTTAPFGYWVTNPSTRPSRAERSFASSGSRWRWGRGRAEGSPAKRTSCLPEAAREAASRAGSRWPSADVSVLPLLVDEPERLSDLVDLERLSNVVERPELHRLERGLDGGEAGDHDDEGSRPTLTGLAKELHPALAGHLEVREDEVELRLLERPDGFQDRRDGPDLMVVVAEEIAELLPEGGIVIDNQDPHAVRTVR